MQVPVGRPELLARQVSVYQPPSGCCCRFSWAMIWSAVMVGLSQGWHLVLAILRTEHMFAP